jgi:predicted lipoprotein
MVEKINSKSKMKKTVIIIFIAFLGYNSFYFKKLSEFNNQKNSAFDFNKYADSLYYKGILKSTNAIDLNELLLQIQTNPDSAFTTYGNRLGIGNSAFFMVKSQGKVNKIENGTFTISSQNGAFINLETKYIFGNAIRDASGLVKLTDFKTNAEFNKVSEALNTLIREKALSPAVQKIKMGDEIHFVGALKLSKKQTLDLNILPVQVILDREL